MTRPPVPPFTEGAARQKVQAAEDVWNTRDPEKVSLAYTEDSRWLNRDEFFEGREETVALPGAQVDPGARLPARKGALGLLREPHLGQVRVREPGRGQWWRPHGNEQ